MSVFIKKGHFCIVQNHTSEIPEKYFFRGYAIISNFPENQKEFDKYENLSNYLNNMKFLGCSYDNKINEDCRQMEAKLNKN